MQNKAFISVIVLALLLIFAWMWLKDTHVEVAWEPDWPEAVRVTADSLEKIQAGPDGKIGEGDLARAKERAHWKAYYFAQLRVAEQLGEMQVDAETVISDLSELDQELRTSMASTVKAAREVSFTVEELDDSVRAEVVVEIPGERLQSFKETLLDALRSGRLKIERRPDAPVGTVASREPASRESTSLRESTSQGTAPQLPASSTASEVGTEDSTEDSTETPPPTVRGPRPAPRPEWTGVVIVLGGGAQTLSAAPTIYDADGSEVGTTLDLPPDRLAAGLPLTSSRQDASVAERVGATPWEFRATVSMGDLFLRDQLDREQAGTFRDLLQEDRVVLVLGDLKQ